MALSKQLPKCLCGRFNTVRRPATHPAGRLPVHDNRLMSAALIAVADRLLRENLLSTGRGHGKLASIAIAALTRGSHEQQPQTVKQLPPLDLPCAVTFPTEDGRYNWLNTVTDVQQRVERVL